MNQLAAGVEYLHSHDIIHRDMKEAIVLLDKDYKIKIADFGLSIRTTANE